MAVQYSDSVRNAMLDAIEIIANGQTVISSGAATQPTLVFYTGAKPANCAASDPAGTVATMTLPSDWMAAASTGTKTLLGTWSVTASGAGTVASYRIKQGATCHEQGTVTISGGGGDIQLDNNVVSAGQTITITAKTITAGNS